MKKIFLAAAFICMALAVKAQPYIYIREHLNIYYVHDISAASTLGNNNEVKITIPKKISKFEYKGNKENPFLNNPRNTGLVDFLNQLLMPEELGGDKLLQIMVREILQITGKKVNLVVFNDFQALMDLENFGADYQVKDIWKYHCYCMTNPNPPKDEEYNRVLAWPCARTFSKVNDEFAGMIGIGNNRLYIEAAYSDENSLIVRRGYLRVFIHELVHTQFDEVLEHSLKINRYGATNKHESLELLPSRNAAFNEAIANAFATIYFFSGALGQRIKNLSFVDKFSLNESLMLDIRGFLLTGGNFFAEVVPDCPRESRHCLVQILQNREEKIIASMNPEQTVCNYQISFLPPDILLHNEYIQMAIFEDYMAFLDVHEIIVDCIKYALDIASPEYEIRTTYDMFSLVFVNMVVEAEHTVNNGGLFTLALLDFYTGFKLSLNNCEQVIGIQFTELRKVLAPEDVTLFLELINAYFEEGHHGKLIALWGERKHQWNIEILDLFASHLSKHKKR